MSESIDNLSIKGRIEGIEIDLSNSSTFLIFSVPVERVGNKYYLKTKEGYFHITPEGEKIKINDTELSSIHGSIEGNKKSYLKLKISSERIPTTTKKHLAVLTLILKEEEDPSKSSKKKKKYEIQALKVLFGE